VCLMGCATTQQPKPPTAKAPAISIHEAVGTGNIEAVKKHLAAGTDVNANDGGWTPLWYAADEGHKEIVELLIAKGADVNAKNKGDVTPLYGAARSGRKEIAELLIAKGADVNARDDVGRIPLHSATGGDHKEIVELLIAKGADVNAKNDKFVGTFLHWAAAGGQNEIVKLLIAKGADVNAKDYAGVTPLDYADGETAALLRKHGGKTKKELEAAGKSIKRIAEATKPKPPTGKAPNISILKAAQEGNIEAVKQHLAAGADVNAKDENGWTPLNSAAVKGRNQIVKLLIEKGADLNAGTPLIFAATDGHMEVVELLIANGADVNAKTNDQLGGTALHMTSNLGHKKAVELLVAAGADVNAKMLHGMTPLHFAANNKGIAKFLIDKGADVNAKLNDGPHNGSTPLDFANVPNLGDPEIADLLRKHGGKTAEELNAAGK